MNNNPNILVIDDDPLVREVIEQFLGSSGYNYRSAADGVAGLDMVNADPPDLVITDILMPKKEGMETIMEIRKAYPDIKIIAISGQGWSGAVSYLDMAQKLGANAALAKPFSKADLLEKIVEVMIDDSEAP